MRIDFNYYLKFLLGNFIFYNKSKVFKRYIQLTNEKEVLFDKISSKVISRWEPLEDIVFTDVGAANGEVMLPVLYELADYFKLESHILEPTNLIKEAEEECEAKNVHFHKTRIDNAALTPSDFVLVDHIVVNFRNLEKELLKIYDAIKPGGIALIIVDHHDSRELRVKKEMGNKKLYNKEIQLKDKVEEIFIYNGIDYSRDKVESQVDVSGVFEMNDDGKALVEYYCNKPFTNISKKVIEHCRMMIMQLAKGNQLSRKEAYFWIEK